MQHPQLIAGLDAELVDEHPPRRRERVERLRLAVGAIEREHQLRAQSLPQWVRRDQTLELANQLAVTAEREPRLDVVFDRRDTELFEPPDRICGEALVADICQRRPAPEPDRLRERVRRRLRAPGGELRASTLHELLEPIQVELTRLEAHEIAGRSRHDHARRGPRRTARLDRLSQLRNIALQRGRRRRRRRLAPDQIDQPLARNDLARMEQEDRQHPALARTSQ